VEAVSKVLGRAGSPTSQLATGEEASPLRAPPGDIAKKLVMSSKTVRSQSSTFSPKLGVNSRAEAVAVAHRTGLALQT
jgi:hypothetical protein